MTLKTRNSKEQGMKKRVKEERLRIRRFFLVEALAGSKQSFMQIREVPKNLSRSIKAAHLPTEGITLL